jgi:hypothetical protein
MIHMPSFRRRLHGVCCVAALALSGCAVPGTPGASAESVLQAQYRARGGQERMSGDEASRVMRRYEAESGARPAIADRSGPAPPAPSDQ